MLEGRLVRLRAIAADDRARAVAWMNDSDVTHFLTARYGLGPDDDFWLVDEGLNSLGWLRLAVDTLEGEHIGGINLHGATPEERSPALGIIIGAKEFWGRGFGTDAIATLLRFAFREQNLQRVWLTVLAEHERAIACYQRCGFREEARLRQDVYRHERYHDFVVMGVSREEFELEEPARNGGRDA